MTSTKSKDYLLFTFWGLLEYLVILVLASPVYVLSGFLLTKDPGILWFLFAFPLIIFHIPVGLLSPLLFLAAQYFLWRKYLNDQRSSTRSVPNVVLRGAGIAGAAILTLFVVLRLRSFILNGVSFIEDPMLLVAELIAVIAAFLFAAFGRFVMLKFAYFIKAKNLLNYLELRS